MNYHSANTFSELMGLIKLGKTRGEFSYHELAEKLAYRSPRSIAMVRKNQRPPSAAMVRGVCNYLRANAHGREFIHLLAEKSLLMKSGHSICSIDERLARLREREIAAALTPPAELPMSISNDLPGVFVGVDPTTPEALRKRILDFVQELASEFRRNPAAS